MTQAQDLRQTISSVAGRPGPVLSAYLSVNADIPENQRRAYLVRLRDAMNDEGVPEDLQQRVREYTEEETHPGARTLAIFADGDARKWDFRCTAFSEIHRSVHVVLRLSVRYPGAPSQFER